jgi:hypothetical protein
MRSHAAGCRTALSCPLGDAGYVRGHVEDGLGPDGESLKDIEDAIGSAYADTLIGTHRENRLVGLEGSAYLFGNGGPDRLDDHWSSSSVASS